MPDIDVELDRINREAAQLRRLIRQKPASPAADLYAERLLHITGQALTMNRAIRARDMEHREVKR